MTSGAHTSVQMNLQVDEVAATREVEVVAILGTVGELQSLNPDIPHRPRRTPPPAMNPQLNPQLNPHQPAITFMVRYKSQSGYPPRTYSSNTVRVDGFPGGPQAVPGIPGHEYDKEYRGQIERRIALPIFQLRFPPEAPGRILPRLSIDLGPDGKIVVADGVGAFQPVPGGRIDLRNENSAQQITNPLMMLTPETTYLAQPSGHSGSGSPNTPGTAPPDSAPPGPATAPRL